MGLFDIINGIDGRLILTEVQNTFTIGYSKDGDNEDRSYNIKANSTSDAKRKFDDYMLANGNDKSEYKIKGVFTSTDIDENDTSSLDGGEGQPDHIDDTECMECSEDIRYINRRDEVYDRMSKLIDNISEVKYSEYAKSDDNSATKKINTSIKDVHRKLYEIENVINHAIRLKTESGLEDIFWKSTRKSFTKISERMLRINNKLREFNI